MSDKVILGKNIQKYRQFRGLDQKQLAEKTGLSESVISKLERGHENISINNLIEISEKLDITLEELFIRDSNLLSLRFVISEHNIETLRLGNLQQAESTQKGAVLSGIAPN